MGCKKAVTYWRPIGGAEDDIYVFRGGSASRVEALPTAGLKPELQNRDKIKKKPDPDDKKNMILIWP